MVLLAVQNEQRCSDPPDPLIRAEGILDEPAHRDEGMGGRAGGGRGWKRRIEDQSADWPFGGERDGDAGAERFTPQDNPSGRITRGRKIVGGRRVEKQTGLRRFARRTAIATVRQPEQSKPVRG